MGIAAAVGTFLFATPVAAAIVAIVFTYVSIFAGLLLINMLNSLSCKIRSNEP